MLAVNAPGLSDRKTGKGRSYKFSRRRLTLSEIDDGVEPWEARSQRVGPAYTKKNPQKQEENWKP